jgi:peptide alpha-N-acetyltransferase
MYPLSLQAYCGETCIGAIVCKLDLHKKMARRGYIAMLAVDNLYRRHQIGKELA